MDRKTLIVSADRDVPLEFDYVNHRGVAERRCVMPVHVRFGTSSYYPQPQWLLLAYDYARKADREFAMSKMTKVEWQ